MSTSVYALASGAGAVTSSAASGTRNVFDQFQRTTATGLGTADVGGAWSVSGSGTAFSVTPGAGMIGHVPSGRSAKATLGVNSTDEDATAVLSLPALPAAGGGFYASVQARVQRDGSAYLGKLRVWPSGMLTLSATRLSGGTETTLGTAGLPQHATPGQNVAVELSVDGNSVRARAYPTSAAVPTWQISTTDSGPAAITTAGGVGLMGYTAANTGPVSIQLSSITGMDLDTAPTAPTSSASTSSPVSAPSTTATTPATAPSSSTAPTTSTPASPSSSTSSTPTTSSSTAPTTTDGSSPGSAPVGSMAYSLPANAIYVSPQGSDSGNGAVTAPYRTIGYAVTRAVSGQTIVLRAGSYNEAVTVPGNKTLTIEPYPHEAAWFDGATTVSGWTKTTNGWAHTGWTPQFDSTAGFTSTIAANNSAPGWNMINPQYPMASHPDQTWIDGVALTQVGSLSALTSGTFYVDYSAQTLYIGSDPTGHTVQASNISDRALVVYSANTVVRGIGFRNYATAIPLMATVVLDGPSDTMSNVVLTHNATTAMYLRSTNLQVDHVTAQSNGLLGILGTYTDGTTISNSVATQNNTEHFNYAPFAGGIKFSRSRNVTVEDSDISGNIGHGLWMDESCYNMTITGNTLSDNLGRGFVSELSDHGIIADNVVTGNIQQGMFLEDTGNIKIWNNTFGAAGTAALQLFQDMRKNVPSTPGHDPRQPNPDPSVPWITANISVMNNQFLGGAQYYIVAADQTGSRTANQMGITVDGNYFYRSSQSGAAEFGWGTQGVKLTAFNSPSAFTAATGQGQNNTDVTGSTPGSAQTLPQTSAQHPLPLPTDVAAAIGRASGSRHSGAFDA